MLSLVAPAGGRWDLGREGGREVGREGRGGSVSSGGGVREETRAVQIPLHYLFAIFGFKKLANIQPALPSPSVS